MQPKKLKNKDSAKEDVFLWASGWPFSTLPAQACPGVVSLSQDWPRADCMGLLTLCHSSPAHWLLWNRPCVAEPLKFSRRIKAKTFCENLELKQKNTLETLYMLNKHTGTSRLMSCQFLTLQLSKHFFEDFRAAYIHSLEPSVIQAGTCLRVHIILQLLISPLTQSQSSPFQ